ncbi:O-fucosyltransferase family protein [Acidisoma silvae]|uniref:O-fucosyltransferase family protein n=1 Tax=Acidisoma silvae TaxID=2802396 RepID=A0A963YSK8_9PROT|nr:O-fucosyltransferase family protein [Acidisoma silvae]MCB8875949.1 O-fucosyltransferase family protein [Acidisoma silvae]
MSDDAHLVCGYAVHGGGGISNQKMALLGAFLDSFESHLPLALPQITEMDQIARKYDAYDFGDIFDEDCIRDFCRRWNVTLRLRDDDTLYRSSYENYFWKTSNLFHSGMFDGRYRERDAFVADAIRSLKTHVGRSRVVDTIVSEINRYPNLAVAQFRIEKDWETHAAHLSALHNLDEDVWLDHDLIAKKIRDEFRMLEYLYVICDEAALLHPKEKIRRDCFDATGLRLIFKSDILTAQESEAFGPLRLSLIDFEIARSAKVFVGNSHSTFSNMAALESYVHLGCPVRHHYVYNKKQSLLRRTDNGLFTRL